MLRFIAVYDDELIAVETVLLDVLNLMVMYLLIDVESHSVDEEVTAVVVQRFTLALMFNRRVVLAADVQDDTAVKDVVNSQ